MVEQLVDRLEERLDARSSSSPAVRAGASDIVTRIANTKNAAAGLERGLMERCCQRLWVEPFAGSRTRPAKPADQLLRPNQAP